MNLDRKPWIFFWRPFYRNFVVPVVWPLLHRLREFFMRETVEDLRRVLQQQNELSRRITALENHLNRLPQQVRQEFIDGFAKLAGDNQQQWTALEELLLNMLSQPVESHSAEYDPSRETANSR